MVLFMGLSLRVSSDDINGNKINVKNKKRKVCSANTVTMMMMMMTATTTTMIITITTFVH